MSTLRLLLIMGRAAAGLLLVAVCGCGAREQPVLRLYCGAGLRPPAAELVAEFARAEGVRVECDYAGSELLLSRIKLTRKGDLYMPGDRHYVAQAEAEGLVAGAVDACWFVPVLLVSSHSPKPVRTLADLAAPGLRVGLGDPQACAVGRVTEQILEKAGVREQVERNVVFRSLTVNELGTQIKVGKLDAAIVWDAIARQYTDAGMIVEIPSEANIISSVPVAVLKTSAYPEAARRFQRFATSERGRAIFARHGYTTSYPGRQPQ